MKICKLFIHRPPFFEYTLLYNPIGPFSQDDSLDDDTETDSKVSSYIQSLPRKQVTLSTPEDEDSDDEAEGPMKVQRRKKNPPLRRINRLEQ